MGRRLDGTCTYIICVVFKSIIFYIDSKHGYSCVQVWVEVLILSGSSAECDRWIHIDPCEAAVDEPLIYQGWGKNLTYIVAVGDPVSDSRAFSLTNRRLRGLSPVFPRFYRDGCSYMAKSDLKISSSLEDQLHCSRDAPILLADVVESYTTDLNAVLYRRDLKLSESDTILRKLSYEHSL